MQKSMASQIRPLVLLGKAVKNIMKMSIPLFLAVIASLGASANSVSAYVLSCKYHKVALSW